MEISYDNAKLKVAELFSYREKTNSDYLRKLIHHCIEQTFFSTFILGQFIEKMKALFEDDVQMEEKMHQDNLENIQQVEIENENIRKLTEEIDPAFKINGLLNTEDYTQDMNSYSEQMEKTMTILKNMFTEFSNLKVRLSAQITSKAIELKQSQLFNELFGTNLTEFKRINTAERNYLINKFLIELMPVLGNIFSYYNSSKEIIKSFKVEKTINDSIEKGDNILIYLEKYLKELDEWNFHTVFLGEVLY